MRIRPTLSAFITFGVVLLFAATPAEAQLGKLKKAAQRGAEDEAARRVEEMAASAVACAFEDLECIEEAEEDGETVVFTDSEGRVITDDDGKPVTDREEAAKAAGGQPEEPAEPAEPGPGSDVWANYDFVPGDRVLFAEDFIDVKVGDFPARLEFLNGNMEIVEWEDMRWLRATSGSAFAVELSETLPDRFTLEFPVHWKHGNQWMRVLFLDEGKLVQPRGVGWYKAPHVQIDERYTGIEDFDKDEPTSTTRVQGMITGGTPTLRVMADGEHVKVYLDEKRVANIPRVDLGRSTKVFFVIADATEKNPMFVGPIRIAAGGADLYDKLVEEGRVATQGIYFEVDSDVIQPESTPTLTEIGEMLQKHEDLRIAIEGHTDSQGADDYNMELSDRRAAAVVGFLVEEYGIDRGRLESAGYGETNPVADNETKEGRAQNRRVELVLLD